MADYFVKRRLLFPILEAFDTLDNTPLRQRFQRLLDASDAAVRFLGYSLDPKGTVAGLDVHMCANDGEYGLIAHRKCFIPDHLYIYAGDLKIGRAARLKLESVFFMGLSNGHCHDLLALR